MRFFLASILALFLVSVHGQTRFLKTFNTVAEVLADNPNSVHTNIWSIGRLSANDGGFGAFYYDRSSTATTNGGTEFSLGSYSGRIRRVWDKAIVNVKWFGAVGDGVADDSVPIENANVVASALKGELFFPPGTYVCQINARQFVSYRGAAQAGAKNAGEGGTILKMPSGTVDGTVFKSAVECSLENVQIDGNKANTTGNGRGIWFDAAGLFKESLISKVTVVNCDGDGIYINAHEVSLDRVASLHNGGNGLTIGPCYDVMLNNILCGWNVGNGFESAANGATLRIYQMDCYYNQGKGAVFHSPYLAVVNRLQCDFNFQQGLDIDVGTTSTYIDIYHPIVYGSNVDQDNFGILNAAASGTYSDVVISGTQYPKNVRLIGGKLGSVSASTKKPSYVLSWSNSQPGIGFNVTLQDIDVDTNGGTVTSTGMSTPSSFLTSASWTGRLMNHRDGTNVRTITRNSLFYHTTDGSTTPPITVFNDYNVFVKSNLLAYGYVTANGAVYSGRAFTADKTGIQIKSDTGEAFGISSVGDSTYIASETDSTPSVRFNGPTGESTITTSLTNTSGTTKGLGIDYTVNQTSGTGSSVGLSVNVTETAKGSGSHRLAQLGVSGTPRVYWETTGRPVVISPNGTSGMLLRGDGSTDSQILLNYAATLDRRLTVTGNSIKSTDAAGSTPQNLTLNDSGTTTVIGGTLRVTTEIELGSGGPTISWGSGVPASSKPNGSHYHRTDGTGPNFYVRENGAWVAK